MFIEVGVSCRNSYSVCKLLRVDYLGGEERAIFSAIVYL